MQGIPEFIAKSNEAIHGGTSGNVQTIRYNLDDAENGTGPAIPHSTIRKDTGRAILWRSTDGRPWIAFRVLSPKVKFTNTRATPTSGISS